MARDTCHVRLVFHPAGAGHMARTSDVRADVLWNCCKDCCWMLMASSITRLLLPQPLAAHQCDPPLGSASGRAFRSTGRVRRGVLRIQAARRAFPRATSDEQPRALAPCLAPCAPQANPHKAATRQKRKKACIAYGESARLAEGGKRCDDGALEPLLAVTVPYACHLPPPPGLILRRSATAKESSRRRSGSANHLAS